MCVLRRYSKTSKGYRQIVKISISRTTGEVKGLAAFI